MRHTFRWLSDDALDLTEADVLAELPALAGWAPVAVSRLAREVESQLPALAAFGSVAR